MISQRNKNISPTRIMKQKNMLTFIFVGSTNITGKNMNGVMTTTIALQ